MLIEYFMVILSNTTIKYKYKYTNTTIKNKYISDL